MGITKIRCLYPIHIFSSLGGLKVGNNLDKSMFLSKLFPTFSPHSDKIKKIVVITDHRVRGLYGKQFIASLSKELDTVPLLFSVKPGESSKSHSVKQALEEKLFAKGCGRDTLMIALGGGVVGDLAGYLAATYMRGIPYIQVPTTLLAMVDSSVGGKTGINTAYGKNLIGAFWQPKAVIADIRCLKSLPKKHIISGLVEVLKIFLTCDKKSFEYAIRNIDKILSQDEVVLQKIISKAVKLKAEIVLRDEREAGDRKILNFGHTIGHAIEQLFDYQLLHGVAVGYGILLEVKIAVLLGYMGEAEETKIIEILNFLGIYARFFKKINIDRLIRNTYLDKKANGDSIYYVVLKNIGKAKLICVPDHIVKLAYLQLV